MAEGLGGPITIAFQRGLRSPLLFYNSATKLTLSMFHHKTAVFIFTENEMVVAVIREVVVAIRGTQVLCIDSPAAATHDASGARITSNSHVTVSTLSAERESPPHTKRPQTAGHAKISLSTHVHSLSDCRIDGRDRRLYLASRILLNSTLTGQIQTLDCRPLHFRQ
ncbi:MAG: hypothetical protein IPJ71_10145 [Bdellovibrionales bacterium]|nr:hypothetical protein [Bdellovibrionales bacterium]